MLKFEKVEMHNFLSYKQAELALDNQGVTLIEGINNSNDAYTSSGSGKSSLLSSITYALYGKTVTGLTSNTVVNKEAGTDCYVKLDFKINDDEYRIERYRKGKHGNANKVRLFLNDKEITEATNPKTDKAIQDLIGIQFATYMNTISYGSSDEPVFSQATDKGKKEILENLANTAIYAKAKSEASDRLSKFKTDLTNAENVKANAETMINQYHELEKQDQERYEKEQERQKANKRALEELKVERDNYAKESEKRLRELSVARERVLSEEPQSDVTDKLSSIEKEYTKANNSVSKIQQALTEKNTMLENLRQQYTSLSKEAVCPVCGRPLDEEHKQKEIAKIVKQGKELKPVVVKYKNTLEELQVVANKLSTQKQDLNKQVASFNTEYKKFQDKLNTIKDEKSEIESKNKMYDIKLSTLTSNSEFEIVLPKCYNSNIKIEQEKLNKASQEIQDLTKKIDNYTILVNKVFSKEGITSVVLDLITPYLNEHANYYLTKLSGSILSIDMNTQKLNANNTLSDKFDLRVHNQAGADSYQNCSAGERKRIDIAIAFAIQDLQQDHNNTATNIAIYDECFDGLDSVGCESVIDILKEKSKTIPSIFVITHNETLKPLFDNSIQVIKSKQGISSIGA